MSGARILVDEMLLTGSRDRVGRDWAAFAVD
jgi:hypothetical protein